ncbi:uncharacterized protein At1g24485-like [Populus nigra]|uniref:uncharacterized protein At1g24485-like n=1 Tax=Populus nigra TaxID=3691 RepID=UPI002B264E39|nr:uncharacterized protein At1g24485-like [Populus nigra]
MRLKSILYAKPDNYSYRAHSFISIDFGSSDSEPYTDENSITWTGDDAYIQSGESQFLKYSTMPYVRDEQSQVFDLQFDGNYWATVNTTHLYDTVPYGAIYTVKANNNSMCLAQTMPNQVPFISALELRSLLHGMYSQAAPNYAMFLNLRVAYRANDTISIRYACICACFEF